MPDGRGGFSPRETAFDARLEKALEVAHTLTDQTLDGSEPSALVDAILADYAARPVEPLYENFYITTREAPPPRIAGQALQTEPMALTLDFTLPCNGAARAIRASSQARGSGDKWEFIMPMDVPREMPLNSSAMQIDIEAIRDQWFDHVRGEAEAANRLIEEKRREMARTVGAIVDGRWNRRRAFAAAAGALNIPLAEPIPNGVSVPLRPVLLNLQAVEAAARGGGNENGLASDIADAIVSQISAFSTALERLPVTANKIAGEDEESIRDVLLFILNANWKGTATGETFLGGGKTDILLRWHDRDAFIGECKFWRGQTYFVEGLEQLLDRYTVWRATRVALILFIRDVKNVTAVIDKARSAICQHARYIGPARPELPETSYAMRAQHDHAQVVTLTLVPVVIPQP